MRLHVAKRVVALLGGAVVAACATLPPPSPSTTVEAADAPFSIGGRISARRGDAGVAGAFTWTHDANRDAIALATPLGQTLAELEGGVHGVTVRLQDGRVESAPSWGELTERAFGVTIPVDGLSSWIRGVPRGRAPFSIERDARNRVSLLRQDGWEVLYAYSDDGQQKPSRVILNLRGGEPVDVRVVVDRWQ